MTREAPHRTAHGPPRPVALSEDERRLYVLLTALCGASGQADTDLGAIGRLLRVRPLSLRIALLGLRIRRLLFVAHDMNRFEAITVTLAPREVSP